MGTLVGPRLRKSEEEGKNDTLTKSGGYFFPHSSDLLSSTKQPYNMELDPRSARSHPLAACEERWALACQCLTDTFNDPKDKVQKQILTYNVLV